MKHTTIICITIISLVQMYLGFESDAVFMFVLYGIYKFIKSEYERVLK